MEKPTVKESKHAKKASNEEMISAYKELQSIYKVAELFKMCPQSVHERLTRLGTINHIRTFTKEEEVRLRDVYAKGFKRGDGALKALSLETGRTVQFLSRQAKKLGLTNNKRTFSDENIQKNSQRMIDHWKTHVHPRGFLGGKHTDAARQKMSDGHRKNWNSLTEEQRANHINKQLLGRLHKYGTLVTNTREKSSWKAGWREIGGKRKYFRSRWEANYARYLEFLKLSGCIHEWQHESKTFWFENIKRGCRSYLPDFEVTLNDGSIEYHEVKGWYDDRSKTKVKRMAKYYPDVKLVMVFGKEYKKIENQCKNLIADWE